MWSSAGSLSPDATNAALDYLAQSDPTFVDEYDRRDDAAQDLAYFNDVVGARFPAIAAIIRSNVEDL
jgi:hypothetical protein